MDKEEKPPDPGGGTSNANVYPQPQFVYTPLVSSIPLTQFSQIEEQVNRKRRLGDVSDEPLSESLINHPTKEPRIRIARSKYTATDLGPFLVHVSKVEINSGGASIQPVNFGLFLKKNEIRDIALGGLKKIGRNRIVIEFKSAAAANGFLNNELLHKNGYTAIIPAYHITRMGVVRDVPVEWNEEDIKNNIEVPHGCGEVLKARRINRKITTDNIHEWKPTQTVVLTFNGQVLPQKVFCCYLALEVSKYVYPSIQCFNCCRYGHTKTQCRAKPRCYKCGSEDHNGNSCEINKEEAVCTLCRGNHFASSKNCPEFERQSTIKSLMSEKVISFTEASQTVPRINTKVSYANVVTQSYKKTIHKPVRPRAPLSQSYDRHAHSLITQDYSSPSSSSKNGCALGTSQPDSTPEIITTIINTLISLLTSIMSSKSTLPDHVMNKLNLINQIVSDGCNNPSMEHSQYN